MIPFKLAWSTRRQSIAKLMIFSLYSCHAIALSENSATKCVQDTIERQFRKSGINSVWSPPVAPHAACTYDTAKRWQASGVSLHSHYPMTSSVMTLEASIDPTRIVSSIVHVGPWHIHAVIPSQRRQPISYYTKQDCKLQRQDYQLWYLGILTIHHILLGPFKPFKFKVTKPHRNSIGQCMVNLCLWLVAKLPAMTRWLSIQI